ncbi:MAG: 50S ribosomal subunit protein L15 [Candidatus Westeberhardia cardiocondylae]|nr:50S ribosomal subunit protein L15 [Candidatus Westeberhardia cardiocondylae]
MVHLNNFSVSKNRKYCRKRFGRGVGSGIGKTCGRGHKGQNSRSGTSVCRRFEGGQTPFYRRLPKFGFISKKFMLTKEIRFSDLNNVKENIIDLDVLKSYKIIKKKILYCKLILSGKISRAFIIRGLKVSKGARIAIENFGGEIKDE